MGNVCRIFVARAHSVAAAGVYDGKGSLSLARAHGAAFITGPSDLARARALLTVYMVYECMCSVYTLRESVL